MIYDIMFVRFRLVFSKMGWKL